MTAAAAPASSRRWSICTSAVKGHAATTSGFRSSSPKYFVRRSTFITVLQGRGARKQDVVLLVNVLVQIALQLEQATQQGDVRTTGVGGRLVVASQGSDPRQSFGGIAVLVLHHANRV